MRNLKKHLSVMLVVAIIFTMMAPVFAVSSSYQASYEDEAEVLYNLGLFKGVSEDKFDPDLGSNLTREQAAIILLRLFGQEQEAQEMSPAEVRVALSRFTDANEISSWARNQVAYATSTGIIHGLPTGEFCPQGNITGKDYACLLLQEVGANVDWGTALESLAELDVLSMAQMIDFDRALLRDDVVCMSYNILSVEMENEDGEKVTVIENLIENGIVDRELAEEYDLVEPLDEEEEPGDVEEPVDVEEPEPIEEANAATVSYAPSASRTLSMGQKLFEIGTVTVTAGDEDVNVTGLKLQKTGMCDDSYIKNITVWSGNEKLNTVGRFNNGLANIALTKLVTVEAGQSAKLSVKINLKEDGGLEGTPEFNIALTEVKADAEIEGNFPMAGNTFAVSKVTLGTMTVKVSGDAPTGTLNAGDQDVRLAKFDIEFGNEAQTLKQIKLTQNGNISSDDIANLKLVDDNGVLATADGLANGAVTFKFEKEYESGTTARLTLRGDVVGGAGRDVQFDVNDQNDIQSEGKVYKTTIVANSSIDGQKLKIAQGSLIVYKDESSPAAATIANNSDNQKFTAIKIEAVGEPVQIEDITLKLVSNSKDNVEKVKMTSEDITIASQTNNLDFVKVLGADNEFTLEMPLSEIVTVNPGNPVIVNVAADINKAGTNNTFQFGICKVKGTGLVSSKDVENVNNVLGSQMTVGDIQLTVEEVAAVESYIFPNQASKELTSFELYHNLGEDVKVSALTVKLTDEDITGENDRETQEKRDRAVKENFSNIRLVTENGTVVSDPVNTPDKETLQITLKDGVVVGAGQTVKLSLVADIRSTAKGSEGHEFEFAAPTATAVTIASGRDVNVIEMPSTRRVVVSDHVDAEDIQALYSVEGDLEDKNILANKEKNQTNLVKLAQWTLQNDSDEAVDVNKIYLTASYKSNLEDGKKLNEAYVNKYALKDGKGNTLATFSTLPSTGAREVTLTKKLEIPEREDGKKGETELVVWANVEKGAQYGGTISVALGKEETETVSYYEVTGKISGETFKCSGAKLIEAAENDKPLVNTVAITKLTASNVSIPTTVKPGTGITVGKFTLKNSGNEAIKMKDIKLIFNQDSSNSVLPNGNNTTAGEALTKLSLYDDKEQIGEDATITRNSNKAEVVFTNIDKKIAAGESKTFEVRLGDGNRLDDGEIVELRLDDKGTTYTDVNYGTCRISIDNYVTLDKVQAVD